MASKTMNPCKVSVFKCLAVVFGAACVVFASKTLLGETLFNYKGIPIFIPDELMNGRSFQIHLSKEFLESRLPGGGEDDDLDEDDLEDLDEEEEPPKPPTDEVPEIPPIPDLEELAEEEVTELLPEEEFPEEELLEEPSAIEEFPEELLEEEEPEDEEPEEEEDEEIPPEPLETNVGNLMLRAWAAYKNGRLERAMAYLRTAEKIAPKHPTIKAMKGSIFYRLGLFEEAKKEWIESLKLKPTQRKIRDYLERMGAQKELEELDEEKRRQQQEEQKEEQRQRPSPQEQPSQPSPNREGSF